MTTIRYAGVRVIDPAQNRDEVTAVVVNAQGQLLFGAAAEATQVDQVEAAEYKLASHTK